MVVTRGQLKPYQPPLPPSYEYIHVMSIDLQDRSNCRRDFIIILKKNLKKVLKSNPEFKFTEGKFNTMMRGVFHNLFERRKDVVRKWFNFKICFKPHSIRIREHYSTCSESRKNSSTIFLCNDN